MCPHVHRGSARSGRPLPFDRAGDLSLPGAGRDPPTIPAGQSLRFVNGDASQTIWHSITACRAPCNLTTGISYPLANGAGGFDSAQLGVGTPASGKLSWSTPAKLKPGTYTFYCRIHPFMRGVFRIIQ